MQNLHRVPRILITNDDGIDAPGLTALIEIAKQFSDDVWVSAPEHDQSGTGQSISLHAPLRINERGEKCWSVSGTPADCVALALAHMMANAPPSLILSGINAGNNTGDDVNMSGTLGAAFMGLMLGIPSIAISQACTTRKTAPWTTSTTVLPKLLDELLRKPFPKDCCLSINIPNLPPEKINGWNWAKQGTRTTATVHVDIREDLRELKYYWLTLRDQNLSNEGNFDHAILLRGQIAVTALSLDRSIDMSSENKSDIRLASTQ